MTERIVHGRWDDEEEDAPPIPLTPEQAQALREAMPSVSAWQVVAAQAVTGLAVAVLFFAFGEGVGSGWSALYGAACGVLPSALLAKGMARLPASGPAAAAVGFMVWEGVKVLLTVAMLVAAVRVVTDLSWPALLAALTVCLSMNWLALLWQGRRKNKSR
jgi:ATP synthase protein I